MNMFRVILLLKSKCYSQGKKSFDTALRIILTVELSIIKRLIVHKPCRNWKAP